jgi:hypothetical protein
MNQSRPLAVLAVLLAACSGGGKAPPASPPSPARRAPVPVAPNARLALSTGYRASAVMERTDSIVLTLPDGSRQVQREARHARFSIDVRQDGSVRVRLDSLTLRPSGPRSEQAERAAIGTVWQGRLTEAGLEGLKASKSGDLVGDIGTTVADFFPALPSGGVLEGTRWADTSESTLQVEVFEAQDHRIRRWEASKRSPREGVLSQPIRRTEEYEQLGKGAQAGREMRMSAQGSSKTTYYLLMTGKLDAILQTDSASRLITIPATRQAVPTIHVVRRSVMFEYP